MGSLNLCLGDHGIQDLVSGALLVGQVAVHHVAAKIRSGRLGVLIDGKVHRALLGLRSFALGFAPLG